jgi:hypothetical protein
LLFDRERTMRLGERDLEPILHGMALHTAASRRIDGSTARSSARRAQ